MDIPTVETQSVTLKGTKVNEALILANEQEYRSDSKLAGQKYHIGRFRGGAFTCTPEFYALHKGGNIQQMTLSKQSFERTIADPADPTKTKTQTVNGWALDGYMTREQYKAYLQGEKEIVELETALTTTKVSAFKELNLDEASIKALIEQV